MSVSHAVCDAVTDTAGEVDTREVASLAVLFGRVPDPREARGVRHRLTTVLTVLTLALLCGARNFRQAADRVAELPQPLLTAAGARRHPVLGVRIPPGRDTLRRLAAAVDAAAVDRLVGVWLAVRLTAPDLGCGLSLDGKTVRNSAGPDGMDVRLFSAMRHDTAVVVAQVRIPDDTTEVTQVEALLDQIGVAGMVITTDAAHPSADTAAYLRRRDADYVFTVKGNKPALLDAITGRLPAATAETSAHTDTEQRGGHRVTRTIWITPAAGVDFPGAVMVFRIRRDVYAPDNQRVSKQIAHGITSLPAPPADLLTYIRTHWCIENKIHWIRDVLFGEDTTTPGSATSPTPWPCYATSRPP